MRKSNKVKRWMTVFTAVLLVCVIFGLMSMRKYREWKEDNSGIPDAVSTVSDGDLCRMTVTANCRIIEDEEKFAENVIKMYRENAFRSIRLSTDLGKVAEKLDIRVYLHRDDIREGNPVMRILYEPPDDEKEYNVIDDAEVYRMTIYTDGRS